MKSTPDPAEAQHNLGVLYGRNPATLDEAVACFRKALAIQPHRAESQLGLGNALSRQGRLGEALICYQEALALRPGSVEARYNLGNTFGRLGRLDEAVACYQAVLALQPRVTEARHNLGMTLVKQGRLDEAVSCYQGVLTLKPDNLEARNALGATYLRQGQIDDALACFQRALSLKPDFALAHNNRLLALHYRANAWPEELWAAHREFAAACETPLKGAWPVHANSRDPERRLRVGYVSPDFRHHSVAYFIEPILAHHDKTRFEVYGYYSNTVQDDFTAGLSGHVDHWLACPGLSDTQLAERIRADGIDILVDLAGHTAGNRLLTFARKPAPVQVTYLGYPDTTGLTAMDYRLSTLEADPPGAEAYNSEALYRLPRGLWCYRPRAGRASTPAAPPAKHNGYVTFGSMNNIAKLSSATIAVWAKLLQAVPGSKLSMTNMPEGSARGLLAERFAAQGIEAERLILQGKLPEAEFERALHQIDIALDPFPYNGTTTTCEALWMGTPVVSLIGNTFVSRSGTVLLKALGLEELLAEDAEAYIGIAAALAGDLERLQALRSGLRARFLASPLRDEAGLTRDLEAAYRNLWQTWCQARPAPA